MREEEKRVNEAVENLIKGNQFEKWYKFNPENKSLKKTSLSDDPDRCFKIEAEDATLACAR